MKTYKEIESQANRILMTLNIKASNAESVAQADKIGDRYVKVAIISARYRENIDKARRNNVFQYKRTERYAWQDVKQPREIYAKY